MLLLELHTAWTRCSASTPHEECNLKGSCYPGEKGWTCSIIRMNASFNALAGLANWANREQGVRR